MRTQLAAIATVVFLVALSACTDGNDELRGESEWMSRAKSVCLKNNQDLSAQLAPLLLAPGPTSLAQLNEPDRKAIASDLATVARRSQQAMNEIGISVPGVRQSTVRRLDRLSRSFLSAALLGVKSPTSSQIAAVLQRGFRLQLVANEATRRLGIAKCVDALGLQSGGSLPTEPVQIIWNCWSSANFAGDIGEAAGAVETPEVGVATDCGRPHDYATYATFQFPAGPSVQFPGEVAVARYGAAECLDRLHALEKSRKLTDSVSFFALVPASAGWNTGARQMRCALYDLRGRQLPGNTTEG